MPTPTPASPATTTFIIVESTTRSVPSPLCREQVCITQSRPRIAGRAAVIHHRRQPSSCLQLTPQDFARHNHVTRLASPLHTSSSTPSCSQFPLSH
ncbi:MerR family transcriptional regulator [Sesbania bispinosa]|nr:MerR family transcriptional regulator [Sesbania bispinosa]